MITVPFVTFGNRLLLDRGLTDLPDNAAVPVGAVFCHGAKMLGIVTGGSADGAIVTITLNKNINALTTARVLGQHVVRSNLQDLRVMA